MDEEIQRQMHLLRYINTLFDSSVYAALLFTGTNTYYICRSILCALLYLDPYSCILSVRCSSVECIYVRFQYGKVHKSMKLWIPPSPDILCTKFCFDHFGSYVVDSVCWQRLHWTDSSVAIGRRLFFLIVFNRIENIFFLFSMISPILSDILFSLFFACASISVFCFKFSNIAFD